MIQVCEKCIEDGEKLLEEMDGEARTAPLQFRAEMLAAVRGLRLGGRCWSGWGTKREGLGLGQGGGIGLVGGLENSDESR